MYPTTEDTPPTSGQLTSNNMLNVTGYDVHSLMKALEENTPDNLFTQDSHPIAIRIINQENQTNPSLLGFIAASWLLSQFIEIKRNKNKDKLELFTKELVTRLETIITNYHHPDISKSELFAEFHQKTKVMATLISSGEYRPYEDTWKKNASTDKLWERVVWLEFQLNNKPKPLAYLDFKLSNHPLLLERLTMESYLKEKDAYNALAQKVLSGHQPTKNEIDNLEQYDRSQLLIAHAALLRAENYIIHCKKNQNEKLDFTKTHHQAVYNILNTFIHDVLDNESEDESEDILKLLKRATTALSMLDKQGIYQWPTQYLSPEADLNYFWEKQFEEFGFSNSEELRLSQHPIVLTHLTLERLYHLKQCDRQSEIALLVDTAYLRLLYKADDQLEIKYQLLYILQQFCSWTLERCFLHDFVDELNAYGEQDMLEAAWYQKMSQHGIPESRFFISSRFPASDISHDRYLQGSLTAKRIMGRAVIARLNTNHLQKESQRNALLTLDEFIEYRKILIQYTQDFDSVSSSDQRYQLTEAKTLLAQLSISNNSEAYQNVISHLINKDFSGEEQRFIVSSTAATLLNQIDYMNSSPSTKLTLQKIILHQAAKLNDNETPCQSEPQTIKTLLKALIEDSTTNEKIAKEAFTYLAQLNTSAEIDNFYDCYRKAVEDRFNGATKVFSPIHQLPTLSHKKTITPFLTAHNYEKLSDNDKLLFVKACVCLLESRLGGPMENDASNQPWVDITLTFYHLEGQPITDIDARDQLIERINKLIKQPKYTPFIVRYYHDKLTVREQPTDKLFDLFHNSGSFILINQIIDHRFESNLAYQWYEKYILFCVANLITPKNNLLAQWSESNASSKIDIEQALKDTLQEYLKEPSPFKTHEVMSKAKKALAPTEKINTLLAGSQLTTFSRRQQQHCAQQDKQHQKKRPSSVSSILSIS